MNPPKSFKQPVYIVRPLLPPLSDFMQRLSAVWDSEWLTNGGAQHGELERELARFLSSPNLSLFNNGTIAMITACQALRLQGEVITTPFTFPATPHVLAWNNLVPVFADIDPITMNLDPNNIEPLITSRTSAILAVHVYGTPCRVAEFDKIAERHGLKMIYDAAHAFATRIDGKSITAWGDASMLSFHATKLFHTAEGGALVVRDPYLKERVDRLKNFGIQDEITVLMPGINGKMNELQAALGLLTLKMVESERLRRRQIADIYAERLGKLAGLRLRPTADNVELSEQYFPVRVSNHEAPLSRDQLHVRLRDFNVYGRRYFFPLCSEYSCYRMLPSAQPSNLPVATIVASEVLCLPYFGALTDDDVHQICDIVTFLWTR